MHMIKSIAPEIWAFDVEWVPDVSTGRRVYNLGKEVPDEEVYEQMFFNGGATEENPRPYLKTVLCRVVSVSAVIRRQNQNGEVKHKLLSLPRFDHPVMNEADLLQKFLEGIGNNKPQLVGFNIVDADLRILIQRAAVSGVTAQNFCKRPEKPWEGVDYFSPQSEYVHDLKRIYGGWGKSTPSLHEIACAARIPGKIETSGDQVLELWEKGKISEIVSYNEYDALTTFLLWLKTIRLSGLISAELIDNEEAIFRGYIENLIENGKGYLKKFLEKWDFLKSN